MGRGPLALLVLLFLAGPAPAASVDRGPRGAVPDDDDATPSGTPAIALDAGAIRAVADSRTGSVRIEWATDVDRPAGFHVYRSLFLGGEWERRTGEPVCRHPPCVWVDADVEPATTYFYEIGAVEEGDREEREGPVAVTTPDRDLATGLGPGHPNPFSHRIEIRFTLARGARATVTIHDISGRRVATLVDDDLPAGDHSRAWDAMTREGQPADAGIYFVQLRAGEVIRTRKIVRISDR
jgi:hypothetical protein